MKREESEYAINCKKDCGPLFGEYHYGISLGYYCNRKNSCYIDNDGRRGYNCHPQYKSSLFVNTDEANEKNNFSVLDYEVFDIDYEDKDNINNLCKHPDIIMEYIETKDMSEESLKQVDDDTKLLSDLDAILCNDSDIRLKISQLCLKNPSELLPDTQIVNQQYDDILREWIGDCKWRLLYRSSEHDYTGKSFHEYCNGKGPTLIVIKSDEGWIFGGYTTQSWEVAHPDEFGSIYYDMI